MEPTSVVGLTFLVLGTCVFCASEQLSDNNFSHDIDFRHPDSGERVKLKSSGRLSDTIDLDRTPGIKRVICQDGKVLIAVEEPGIGKSWKPGQTILGSSKWDCFRDTLDSTKRGIYAKIESIYFPTDTGISVNTKEAGPFDVIDEATIEFSYSPGDSSKHPPELRQRYRRDLANVLKELLGEINWEAHNTTRIPWNYDDEKSSVKGKITLFASDDDVEVAYGEHEIEDNSTKEVFSCRHCHGLSDFEYTMQIHISKNEMNQPQIHKYISQLKCNMSMTMDPKLTANPSTTHAFAEVFKQPPTLWFSIPVAQVASKKLPPVILAVTYESTTFLNISFESQGVSTISRQVQINGSYTVTQTYTPADGMQGNVTVHDWSIEQSTGSDVTEVEMDLDMNVAIYQKMMFNTSIGWSERDMEIKFSPPIEFRIVPTFSATSKKAENEERCTTSDVTITGEFNVTAAELIVNAFGTSIWDVMLSEGFRTSAYLAKEKLTGLCVADCPGRVHREETRSMKEVCGPAGGRIARNDTEFNSLDQFFGDSILFLSEEATSSRWCGYPGRACVHCVRKTKGENTTDKCADRMMTSEMRTSLSRLGSLVLAEWHDRYLLVLEAWDEPTSEYPDGQHGNNSLFYEGRAAHITLTNIALSSNGSVEPSSDISSRLQRLAQLADCAGIPYINIQHDQKVLEIAVRKPQTKEPQNHKRKKGGGHTMTDFDAFEYALEHIPTLVDADECVETTGMTELPPHIAWPITTGDESIVVGGPTNRIHRANVEEMKRMVEYPDVDVTFAPEGDKSTDCGGRQCRDCNQTPRGHEVHTWCDTRVMAPRMALRLRRLASLTTSGITVMQAYMNKENQDSRLYLEGRALRLKHRRLNLPQFGALCVCAGFDFVRPSVDQTYIEVFVRDQDGYRSTVISYPSGQAFLAVKPPKHFEIPESLVDEPRVPLLIDGFDDTLAMSDYFVLRDFKYRANGQSKRYLRIDPLLVGCLDQARRTFGKGNNGFVIKTAYKPLHDKTDSRRLSDNERTRLQAGLAVEVEPEVTGEENMRKLGLAFLNSCPSTLRLLRLGMTLGIGTMSFYVDVHPLTSDADRTFVNLYIREYYRNKGIPQDVTRSLQQAWRQMTKGGPEIFPYDADAACTEPTLGREKFYLSFTLSNIGMCLHFGEKKFCDETVQPRQDAMNKLWKEMDKSAGSGSLDVVKGRLLECLVKQCGGCPGSGSVWTAKVKFCSEVVSEYLRHAQLLKKNDRVAFFNTGNRESTAHSMACSEANGMKCAEHLQLYSLLQEILATRYKPDPKTTIEEEVFAGTDNPSPLLEIVEQELAMAASGNVSVYLESYRDISAMRNVLKILLIYNNKIDYVHFHLLHGVKQNKVAKSIARKLDTWAGISCPLWSRFSATPFAFNQVSSARTARSLKDSENRNEAQHRIQNWEMDWLLQT